MWKKALVCMMTLLGSCVFAYAYFQNQISAATGTPPTYTIGDTIYYAGSTYTYVGSDGTNLLLLNNASIANNQTWDNAKTSANNHKNNLGNLGKTIVSSELPTTTTLQQASTMSGGKITQLNANIPKITTTWFLGDTDLQSSNLIRFLSANNKSEGTQSIQTYKAIGNNTTCQTPTTSNTAAGTGRYKLFTIGGETITWNKKATYTFRNQMSQTARIRVFKNTDCSNPTDSFLTEVPNINSTYSVIVSQPNYKGKITVDANPRVVLTNYNSSSNVFDIPSQGASRVRSITGAQCYTVKYSGSTTDVSRYNSSLGGIVGGIKFSESLTLTTILQSIDSIETGSFTCPSVTNNAYNASVRPMIMVPICKILYGKSAKPTITTSNQINGSEPTNDNGVVDSYLTMETDQMHVDLQTGAAGVKGSVYEAKKTAGSTTISLPLTITGTQEGTRYIAAKATDTSGNEVYSVLSTISNTSPTITLDYSNLVNAGDMSFGLELYVLDSGIGNTMYRSEGTPIIVEFQKSASSLSFTDPNTTNIKLGNGDIKETITTDNTEITTTGDTAVKYTLSGGISGTGLSITNDPSEPKGFTISVGNIPNPNLPTDFTLTAELETPNSTKATATKQIHVFQGMSDFKWTPIKTGSFSTSEAMNNQKMGDLSVSNGLPKFTYELTSPSDSGYDATKARDNGNFVIANTPLESGQKAEVKTNTSLSPGTYNIQCKVTDAYGDVLYTDFTITVGTKDQNFMYTDIGGTELPKTGSKYNEYKEIYAPNKTFQLYTAGNPTGSTVTYQLKAGGSTDVISVDPSGLVTILNASQTADLEKVIVEATSHDPSGTYSDKTIELPIMIEQGTRTIEFADNPIYVSNGNGSVTPNIYTDGVLDTDSNTRIEVDPNEDNSIVWTNDGKTIHYDYSGDNGKDILLHVTKQGDRNYKAATADGILHIIGAKENVLTLSTPGKIIYGDHFTIQSTQDDTNSTNVRYTFETDNTVFISAPQVSGNKAEFDALGNSGSTQITITVTREADGEVTLSKQVKIKVLPKPITIQIDDKQKKRLEDNPPLTYQDITSQLVSWNGVLDDVNTDVIKLSTTAKKYSPVGSYPITAKNVIQQLNDNYPNYTFTLNEGILNILDNGNKDFLDPDGDGCPDLNIKLKDENGNVITINGDLNDDGIPDYNIDSNGDGKADLNIDTDNDGKPDVNLTILKEWKPTQCVTVNGEQYASGINAKAEINIDLNKDMIPDIDIDNQGDFQPHLNISKDGKTAQVNLVDIHTWKPIHDYKQGNFPYDSIGEDQKEYQPTINIDTDGDGLPDLNIDLDNDGQPDINIDTDGDFIPDIDIDGNGDGNPDINVDQDGDGTADESIIKISEWKPGHNVDEPFAYDTMKIESKPQLEDNGIIIQKPDGDSFLPNMSLQVIDVTKEMAEKITNSALTIIREQEIKQVYEIKLLKDGIEVQPNGILLIKLPIPEGIGHPSILIQNEDGEYEKAAITIKDGYFVYESDHLGMVSILGDKREVHGSYYPGSNTGGVLTGDTTHIGNHLIINFISMMLLFFLHHQRRLSRNP